TTGPDSGAVMRTLRLAASTSPEAAMPRKYGLRGGGRSGARSGGAMLEAATAQIARGNPTMASPIEIHLIMLLPPHPRPGFARCASITRDRPAGSGRLPSE